MVPVDGRMTGLSLADLPEAEEMYRAGADFGRRRPQSSGIFPVFRGAGGDQRAGVCGCAGGGSVSARRADRARPHEVDAGGADRIVGGPALGRNMEWLSDLFIDYVPMYNKFRTVESILVIAEFTMPLLAMLGLRQFLKSKDPWGEYRRPLVISFGVCMTICLVGIIAPGVFGHYLSEPEYEYVENGAVRQMPLLFGAVEKLLPRHGIGRCPEIVSDHRHRIFGPGPLCPPQGGRHCGGGSDRSADTV